MIILELEDFTPPELRPKARELSRHVFDRWRKAGAVAAARINPLETCGNDDLIGVLAGRPDLILMSKGATPQQVVALEKATGGTMELIPNVETAAGLVNAFAIARASTRVSAMLVASEDMVADLSTARSRRSMMLRFR